MVSEEAIRILVIEDNPGDVVLIREMLKGENNASYLLDHCTYLSEGLSRLSKGNVDVVVLDLSLPDSQGYETFSQVYEHAPEIPIVLLTGLDDEDLATRALREGAQDYLNKSNLDSRLLSRSIRYACERKNASERLSESERLFERMYTSLRDAVFILDDQTMQISDCNPSACEMFGFGKEQFIGKSLDILFDGKDIAKHIPSQLGSKETSSHTETLHETLMTRMDGTQFHAEYSVVPLGKGQHQSIGWVLIIRDITARKKNEEELRESEERYMLATQGANDGLWDWDLRSNKMHFSTRWKAMLGYGDHEIADSPEEWFKRIHTEDVERVRLSLSSHLNGYTPHFEIEYRILHKDGSYLWELCRGLAVRDENGVPYRMAGSQSDITAKKKAEEQLLHDAFHDSLTGLPNRALFLDRLGRAIEHTKRRKNYLFAVLFLDLDRFKIINDSLGHLVGDNLLIQIANRLKGCLRSGDTIARMGGDEFMILLEDIKDPQDALVISGRIQHKLSNPFSVNNNNVFSSASIGIVYSTADYDNKEDVMRDADIAMYEAKLMGRDCHAIFSINMREQAFTRMELENDLRHALVRNQLFLHYQPIISLKDNQIIGFEALLRWNHPHKGEIKPAEFIPVAEETGLIYDIGDWVIREASRQMVQWHKKFPSDPQLRICVNISSRQFTQANIVDKIKSILSETKLPPNCLGLEITENVLMENAEVVDNLLIALRNLGVRFHIDDFGTGYSSLSYLQRFPISTLKIDSSFIHRLGNSGDRSEIVKTILVLAEELGMETVAEGVETESQINELYSLNCPFVQGYYFSPPMPKEAIDEMLEARLQLRVDDSRVFEKVKSFK